MEDTFNSARSPVHFSAARLKRLLNIWPPYCGTGIRVAHISDDFSRIIVKMTLRWYNQNAVGKHFGGSLFAMTDPFYMLMLMKILGPGYKVMDKSGGIEFLRPGQGTVTADFVLNEDAIRRIRQQTQNGEKYLPEFSVDITAEDGRAVARVNKVIYIKKC